MDNIDEEIKKTEEKIKSLKKEHKKIDEKVDFKTTVFSLVFVVLLVFGVIYFLDDQSGSENKKADTKTSELVSKRGVHLHPNVKITIKGENVIIPPNTGIRPDGFHEPMHTHDASGTIHIEIPGRVSSDDLVLERFFKIWGKTFNENCIFENCNGEKGTLKMLVNGKENTEFEKYSLRDKDKIEIIFE